VSLHTFCDIDASGLHSDDGKVGNIIVRLNKLVSEPPECAIHIVC
jgi:hypothetical protein